MNFSQENIAVHGQQPEESEVETIVSEPRFDQIKEDLSSMFKINIDDETMLENTFIKNDFYKAVTEDLLDERYFVLDYMVNEKLHSKGPSLLTKEDLISRGIEKYRDHAQIILAKSKEPARSRIKELFISSGLLTEEETKTVVSG